MGDLKFVPQSVLDTWSDLGKIELAGTTLRIPSESISFTLTPALRFLTLIEGQDSHKLLAKVKPESYIKEIGGEVMTDSCLLGETAYQVQPGFLAEAAALAAAQTAQATRRPSRADPLRGSPSSHLAPAPLDPSAAVTEEAEMLPPFLLESLD